MVTGIPSRAGARGEADAFGELLAQYHNYLRLMARTLLGSTVTLRVDSSDVVQEAFLEAYRDFPRFAGSTEAELLAWLRRILRATSLTGHGM